MNFSFNHTSNIIPFRECKDGDVGVISDSSSPESGTFVCFKKRQTDGEVEMILIGKPSNFGFYPLDLKIRILQKGDTITVS